MALLSFDDVLFEIGNPGRFRILLFLLLVGNMFPVGLNSSFIIFTAFVPAHRCKLPSYDEIDEDNVNFTHVGSCQLLVSRNESKEVVDCLYGMDYDIPDYEKFVSTEFDLVCGRKYIRVIGLIFQYTGIMLGGIFFGFASDHFGRRISMISSMLLHNVFSIFLAFTWSPVTYFLCGFLLGISIQGLHSTAYTCSSELFHPNQRTYQGIFISVPWSMSLVINALLFWLLGRWNHVQMVIAFISLLCILYIWFIPESLRWLMSRGRVNEACNVYFKFCRFNKIQVRDDAKSDLMQISMKMMKLQTASEKASYSQLFRSRKLRFYSFILGFLYFSASLLYLGVNFVIPKLGGNMYACYVISGCLELTARLSSTFVFHRFGRRVPLTCICVLSCFSCSLSTLIRHFVLGGPVVSEYASIIFAVSGMFLITAGFTGLGLCLTEIYPTLLRAVGLGFCVTCGRIGSMVLPAIMMLEFAWEPLPIILSSLLGLISGALVLSLPETNKKPLQDSVNESLLDLEQPHRQNMEEKKK